MDLLQPFDLILFGGTGDLATRKLIPAMFNIHAEGQWPNDSRLISIARSQYSREDYLRFLDDEAKPHISGELLEKGCWEDFCAAIDYQSIDLYNSESYTALATKLADRTEMARLFYLSTGPSLFGPICEHLGEHHLVTKKSRIAVEKPLGRDLESARRINAQMSSHFEEEQIYRIDHYLGKEPVQNLIALRFGNALFEPLWRRGRIRDVQITVAEQLGMEGRGEFYDTTGALRDMIQNHLLQMLCIIAMEPPSTLAGDSVRDEKLKVLRALKPLQGEDVVRNTVRGQYIKGIVNSKTVTDYTDEPGVAEDSDTETFVALRAEVDSWRWSGVPFYLRTGKSMQSKVSEIVINFEAVPHSIFNNEPSLPPPNRLVIQMQPSEGIKLSIMAKKPGDGMRLTPVNLNLDLTETYKKDSYNAYQRLLVDLIRGNLSLFMRHDELDAAWSWIDPIIRTWADREVKTKPYPAGTWGPAASSALIARDGLSWHEESP
ncbi:MAG: glucose-6-phosphate dehydrogenase [Gammaproteobacteria bacterium]|nr:glucose-6-phosphate dehydrogenase [Gammaproteobacteria bacterium]